MANQKTAKALRELFLTHIGYEAFEGMTYQGQTSEGVVFTTLDEAEDVVVVRVIVKAEGFDYNEAIADYTAKLEAIANKRKEA